jgi:hypothetical protein
MKCYYCNQETIPPETYAARPQYHTCYRHPRFLVQQHYVLTKDGDGEEFAITIVRPFKNKYYEIMLIPQSNETYIYELKYMAYMGYMTWYRNGANGWIAHLNTCPSITPENIDDKLSMFMTFS